MGQTAQCTVVAVQCCNRSNVGWVLREWSSNTPGNAKTVSVSNFAIGSLISLAEASTVTKSTLTSSKKIQPFLRYYQRWMELITQPHNKKDRLQGLDRLDYYSKIRQGTQLADSLTLLDAPLQP